MSFFSSSQCLLRYIPSLADAIETLSPELIRVFIVEIGAQSKYLVPQKGYKGPSNAAILSLLVKRYVTAAELTRSKQISDAVEYCLRYSPETVSSLFKRITDTALTAAYLSDVLVPSLETLYRLSEAHANTSPRAHFASFFKAVTDAWMDKVFVQKPEEKNDKTSSLSLLQKWLCNTGCADCTSVKKFFEEENRILSLRKIGAPRKNHLEGKLGHLSALCTFEVIRTSPRGVEVCFAALREDTKLIINNLQIYKNADTNKTGQWKASQLKGSEILKTIGGGDEERLKRVLGNSYSSVIGLVRGAEASPTKASTTAVTTTLSVKRTAQDDAQLPSAKRQKVITGSKAGKK